MPFFQNYNSSSLFGLDNPIVKRELERIHKTSLQCQVTEWDDLEIMTKFFYKHLYQNIATTNLPWYRFFVNWKTQKSNIIELTNALKKIYPSDFTVDDRILRNWRAMLRAVGCTNITPFSKQESKVSNYLFYYYLKNGCSIVNLTITFNSLNFGRQL